MPASESLGDALLAEVPPRWRAIGAALRDPGLPREVEDRPVRVEAVLGAERAVEYIRLVVSCPVQARCERYRNCTMPGRCGQLEVLAYLRLLVQAVARWLRHTDRQQHVAHYPSPREVAEYGRSRRWFEP